MPDPVPLGLRGQVGAEGLQGIFGGRNGLVSAPAVAAGFTVAEVKAQEDGPEGVAAGIQGGPGFRLGMVLGSPRNTPFAEGGQGTGQSTFGR
jgi:hypothetical protein